MDLYVKQLSSEIKQKCKQITNKLSNLSSSSKRVLAEAFDNISAYEKYYNLIKDADEKQVSPGNLPFSVYSKPEPLNKKEDEDESETISNILDDKKKVFERNRKALRQEAIAIEQAMTEYVELIEDLQDYYEDLIEGIKF